MKFSHDKAFTLIELLVTISIIGVLSSIILISLSSARNKSNEAVIIQNLTQFRNLYELAYSNNGDYSALQPSTVGAGQHCSFFSGSNGYICTANTTEKCGDIYGTNGPIDNKNALALCNQIAEMTGLFGVALSDTSNPEISKQKYSLWAWLPSQNKFMCMGSSKEQSITSVSPTSLSNNAKGCPLFP